MAKAAKGIRISALAKDLNVDNKAILEKLRAEGMGDVAPNHMSTVSIGLAETIKEWFHVSGGGTAVETAAPVDLVAAKPKVTRKRAPKKATAKKASAAESDSAEGNVAVADKKLCKLLAPLSDGGGNPIQERRAFFGGRKSPGLERLMRGGDGGFRFVWPTFGGGAGHAPIEGVSQN